jgi:hypothetical protein
VRVTSIEVTKSNLRGRCVGVASLLAVFAGCATSDYFYLDKRSVKCSPFHEAIEFLPEKPERRHTALAHVEAGQVLFLWVRWEALRKHLCLQAVQLGADAVILPKLSDHPYDIGTITLGVAGRNKKLTGIAIVYTEDDAPEALESVDTPLLDE